MGLGPIMAHLPGPLQPLPASIAASRTPPASKVWCFLGDGECDEPESLGATDAGLAREARQPDLRHQLQPAAARRPGARQRQDHPGAGGRLPRRRLERHQGHLGQRVGRRCSPPTRAACSSSAWARWSTASIQKYTVETGAYIRKHFFGKYPELLKLVEHLSDEQLGKLKRGGHDPEKVYAAYKAAVDHKGSPDGHSGPDGQGLRPRRSRRRQQHHPPAEETQRGRPARIPHPLRHSHLRRGRRQGRFLQARRRQPRDAATCTNAARRWAATLPARGVHCPVAASAPGDEFVQTYVKGSGDKTPSTTMAFVDMLDRLLRRQGARQVDRADHPRRGADLRHGPVLRQLQDLLQRRPALRAGRCRIPGVGLPRGEGRPDSGGRHHRGRLDVVVHRRRHGLRHARHADDPVLHLLLDVRLPAHRRPDLGRRRHAHARLPARRHRRPDHAQRRRPAARGRPQPRARLDGAEPGRLRSRLSPTSWPSSSGTAFAACTRTEGRHLLLHHARTTTTIRCWPMPEGATEGILQGLYKLRPSAISRRRDRRSTCSAAARSCRTRCGRRNCWPSSSTWRPTSGASPATRSCAATRWRSERWNLLHPGEKPQQSYLETDSGQGAGRVRGGVSDYMRAVPEMIGRWVPGGLFPLGTDGFGRSDTRAALRRHFEVDAECIAVAALAQLARRGRRQAGSGPAGDAEVRHRSREGQIAHEGVKHSAEPLAEDGNRRSPGHSLTTQGIEWRARSSSRRSRKASTASRSTRSRSPSATWSTKDQPLLEVQADKAALEVTSPIGRAGSSKMLRQGRRSDQGRPALLRHRRAPTATVAAAPPEKAAAAAEARTSRRLHAAPRRPRRAARPVPTPSCRDAPAGAPASPPTASCRAAGPAHAPAGPRAGHRSCARCPVPAVPGRIIEEDVKTYVAQLRPTAVPSPGPWPRARQRRPAALRGLGGRSSGSRYRRSARSTARQMSLAWSQIPHVTQHDLADITDLEAFRKAAGRQGPKLTVTAFALKAAAIAPEGVSDVSTPASTRANNQLVCKRHYHLGVAVDTETGLLVPVLRDVDKKSVLQLAAEMTALADRARDGKLDRRRLKGGTFTITNLGGIGGTAFTPIVNWPEVAILGLSRSRLEPVVPRRRGRAAPDAAAVAVLRSSRHRRRRRRALHAPHRRDAREPAADGTDAVALVISH